jgi:selenocysteine lyase/cysteine desulfurase
MTPTLPAPKSDFIGLEGKVHLATGGEPPLLKAHRQAFEHFAEDKADGFSGYHRHWVVVDEVRARIARWTGMEPGDIALLGNASEGIMRVVSSFDWRPGDNVVAPELDYASGRYALASLKARGVELRLVPLRDAPTALMVDASHALGAVPVRGDLADFVVSCCYKFALGIHEGILGWNRRRWPDFVPEGAGWFSADAGANPGEFHQKVNASRAEYGNAGHLGAYMLRCSLDYLDSYGVDAIAAHVRMLSGRLVEGMTALGLDVMTPTDPASRAGNAAFARLDTGSFIQKAKQDGILIWGDNGRIRASAHLFTTREDIEFFLARLPGYLA